MTNNFYDWKHWRCGAESCGTRAVLKIQFGDNSDSVNFEDFEEMYPYFDEKPENNSESLFQLLTDNMKNYKVKRPLAYNENSKSIQKTSAKENIQTLDIFLSHCI
ncbi:7437_t:CDS:2 [Entrophospora sp. SA101]|nr:7437_t:CDS:2 [Entrophospora sp. SA101]